MGMRLNVLPCALPLCRALTQPLAGDSRSAHPEGLDGRRGRDGEIAEARAEPALVEIDPHKAARYQRVVAIGVGVYQRLVDVEQVEIPWRISSNVLDAPAPRYPTRSARSTAYSIVQLARRPSSLRVISK